MRKTLIAFGLVWLFVWCAIGMLLGSKHLAYIAELETLAKNGEHVKFVQTWQDWKTRTVNHSHALNFSFLAILVGLIMPEIGFSDRGKKAIAYALILGTVLTGIFSWYVRVLPLMGLGNILITIAVLASAIGFIRGSKKEEESEKETNEKED
jgi:hypothetical protein